MIINNDIHKNLSKKKILKSFHFFLNSNLFRYRWIKFLNLLIELWDRKMIEPCVFSNINFWNPIHFTLLFRLLQKISSLLVPGIPCSEWKNKQVKCSFSERKIRMAYEKIFQVTGKDKSRSISFVGWTPFDLCMQFRENDTTKSFYYLYMKLTSSFKEITVNYKLSNEIHIYFRLSIYTVNALNLLKNIEHVWHI